MNQPIASYRQWAAAGRTRRFLPPSARAFTLVELMVAVTGGLFVSLVVFALARDGSRFYHRESRMAEATLGSVIGFDRLKSDIGRAGYLSTPNIRSDPMFCGDVTQFDNFPMLKSLASIQITASADTNVTTNPVLQSAVPPIAPQNLLLSGAFDSVERFDVIAVFVQDSEYAVRLQSTRGALLRLNYPNLTAEARTALMTRLFPSNRALRLYATDSGTFQIGVITRTGELNGAPTIFLAANPMLRLSGQTATRCNAATHQMVNVINFIQYGLRKVRGNADYPDHQQLFIADALASDNRVVPGEATRLELVREELDVSGNVVASTREVVAEYAVDLRFAITQIDNPLTAPTLTTHGFASPNVLTIAGSTGIAGVLARPQSIRSVRARLSIRSREADRDANINTTAGNIAPGLYRIALGDSGKPPFARVRTLQADTFIASHAEVTW